MLKQFAKLYGLNLFIKKKVYEWNKDDNIHK